MIKRLCKSIGVPVVEYRGFLTLGNACGAALPAGQWLEKNLQQGFAACKFAVLPFRC